MFYDVYERLCRKKGKSVTTACREIGISANAPRAWKEGSVPRIDSLIKIAEYFGVTVEELQDEPPKEPIMLSPIITEEEMRVVAQYRQLTAENREKAREYMEFLQMKQPKEKVQVS